MAEITATSQRAGEVKVNKLRAALAVLLVAGWCLIGAITMLICRTFRLQATERFPLLFHGCMCRLFNMQVEYEGQVRVDRPTIYAANHTSYLDVFVLGSKLPGAFVAKSEVASWPIFGKLARLQNTLFLERRSVRAASQIEQLREHLHHHSNVILFPEGTSTNGTWVAPFRSSLFAAGEEASVQPVTVAYLDYDGEPMGQPQRDLYAWYLPDPAKPVPNKPFAAHFFNALGLKPSRVRVKFHEPVAIHKGQRKEAAAICEAEVRQSLEQILSHQQAPSKQ